MDKKSGGFTLVELIVVIAVLGIIAAIAVPRFTGLKSVAEERVCENNRNQVERMYEAYLLMENAEHSDTLFIQYLKDYGQAICPNYGQIYYEDGQVKCSVHTDGENTESDDEDDGSVPFL